MGLDISIRYRREGATPVVDTDGSISYQDEDICRSNHDFNGRSEFACVREWIGDDRYAQYIDMVGDSYTSLMNTILKELNTRDDFTWDDTDEDDRTHGCPIWLESDEQWGLRSLYTLLARAPEFKKRGWIMQIECDW